MAWSILHTVCHPQWGGLERRVYNECCWMKKAGHRPLIVAPPGSRILAEAKAQGWTTLALSFKRISMPLDFHRLRSFFRSENPHVLNTHGNLDTKIGLAAAWGLKIPYIIVSRHVSPAVSPTFYNRAIYQRGCHHIFTTAECITTQLIEDLGVSEDRISTMPSGIIVPKALPAPADARNWLRKELGLPHQARFLGYVGRLAPDKGIDDIREAFKAIRGDFPDHHLILVGKADKNNSRTIEERIHYMGFHEDPWPFYRAFDVKILASTHHDGIPQDILEAMFAECPVVGTDVGGIPDIIHHLETGLLVPPRDPLKLSESIRECLTNPSGARSRAQKALEMVRSQYTIDQMGERILDLYRQNLVNFRR